MHSATASNKQYHIACGQGELTEYLLVPGDPDRIPRIAKLWDSAKKVSGHREFLSYKGIYKGVPISALSTGIGPACMSIAVNEASKIGVSTFIRVGSTGAIQKHIPCGDLIISTAAVRLDFTSNCYIIPEYPAVANYEVLLALIEAAESLGIRNYHVGITATTSDFYSGQSRRTARNSSSQMEKILSTMQKARVLSFDMETATLYTLTGLFGLRSAAVFAAYANRYTNEFEPGKGEREAIKIANEAVKVLSEWDTTKRIKKKHWLFPSLLPR